MKQKDIDNILKANKKLDWVKRLYEKDTPYCPYYLDSHIP